MQWDPIDVVTTANCSLMWALFLISKLLMYARTGVSSMGEMMCRAPQWNATVAPSDMFFWAVWFTLCNNTALRHWGGGKLAAV